jgi:uncharacterized membrane protein YdjX (TVP38/TMEM64 family)
MESISKKRGRIFILSVIFLALIWMSYSYITKGFIYDYFTGQTLSMVERIDSFREIAFVIFIVLVIIECVFAPFPPLFLYIAGGAVFGWVAAGILGLIGNFIGAGIAFQLSRNYARGWAVEKIPPKTIKKLDNFSLKYGTLSIFLLRLNPLTSSDLFSYAAGLTKMNFRKFLIATTLALAPSIFLQAYLGDKFLEVLFLKETLIIIGILYFLGFFYFYLRRKKFKK